MSQLALGELVEKIALVLSAVLPPQKQPAAGAGVKGGIGIVAGGQGVRSVVQRPIQQSAEFDGAVAVQTGIWRTALGVFGDEAVYDLRLEETAEIQYCVGDAQSGGNLPGRFYVCVSALDAGSRGWLQPQSDAEHVIAHAQQQKGGAGAVHAAAHCHANTFESHENLLFVEIDPL